MFWQPALPERYVKMSEAELAVAIAAQRERLGDDLLILGHHYQQDSVIQHADLTGDSLKLSQLAAEESVKRGTSFLVFCGVHFMAETADMLTDDSVQVILPDFSAGCSMADMAAYDDTVEAWEAIHDAIAKRQNVETSKRQTSRRQERTGQQIDEEAGSDEALRGRPGSSARKALDLYRAPAARRSGPSSLRSSDPASHSELPPRRAGSTRNSEFRSRVIPITYVNSSAAIKAFVGEHGGACCTSSNALEVFKWALAGGTQPVAADEEIKVLFLPDQHLGRNTASKMGILTEVDEAAGKGRAETAVWDPRKDDGGLTVEQIQHAKVLLWAGHCSVHKLFRPEHVDQVRAHFADKGGVTVLVHPECCKEVVDKADLDGSTEFIIRTIRNAAPGSNWAVGTEIHLVNRLASEMAERGDHVGDHVGGVRILSDCQCLCTTMYRIDQQHLLWALDNLVEGTVVNRISVPPRVREPAVLALERMLANTGGRATAACGAAAN